MAAQSRYFDERGPSVRLNFLGAEGHLTHDPKNIGAMLSTHFQGLFLMTTQSSQIQEA